MKRFNTFTLAVAVASLFFAITMMSGGVAVAASYQQIDGTIVDPILTTAGGVHPFSGNDLTAGALLLNANLAGADLVRADLFGVHLEGATLSGANLTNAFLRDADVSNVNFNNAILVGADLHSADFMEFSFGSAFYDINTDFSGTSFDPVAAGWTLVPEPSTALLLGVGLAGMGMRRRQRTHWRGCC